MAETGSADQKALRINQEGARFGTFAEIGAGQEVVRWFFHVGKASATVAKSISAYDMTVSDEIYGRADHYVSRAFGEGKKRRGRAAHLGSFDASVLPLR